MNFCVTPMATAKQSRTALILARTVIFVTYLLAASIAFSDPLANEIAIRNKLNLLGFSEVNVNGCVVHVTIKERSVNNAVEHVVFEERVDLRTLDFSTAEFFQARGNAGYIGDVEFNDTYHSEKVKIAYLASVFAKKYGLPWPDYTKFLADSSYSQFERDLEDLNVYFWNYRRYRPHPNSITTPSFLSFYILGEDEAALRDVFNLFEARAKIPVCTGILEQK